MGPWEATPKLGSFAKAWIVSPKPALFHQSLESSARCWASAWEASEGDVMQIARLPYSSYRSRNPSRRSRRLRALLRWGGKDIPGKTSLSGVLPAASSSEGHDCLEHSARDRRAGAPRLRPPPREPPAASDHPLLGATRRGEQSAGACKHP